MTMRTGNGCPRGTIVGWCIAVAAVMAVTQAGAVGMAFEDATARAGIRFVEPTAGAAWGDANGDGLPDLWIGNHRVEGEGGLSNRPVLLINLGGGRFRDEAASRLDVPAGADPHGAGWADFDNDGDQDLVVLCGAGGGYAANPNLLLVNTDGAFVERAAELGVAYGLARGRTPLWLDADADGHLDLLVVNHPRRDGKAPNALFHNDDGKAFRRLDAGLDEALAPWGMVDRIRAVWHGLIAARLRTSLPRITAGDPFPLLTAIGRRQAQPRVALFSTGTRFLRLENGRFTDATPQFGLPSVPGVVTDAAIGDLNGDGVPDFALARSLGEVNDLVQPAPHRVDALLTRRRTVDHRARLRFTSEGPLHIELEYVWRPPKLPAPRVSVGGMVRMFEGRHMVLDLTPEQAANGSTTQAADVRITHRDGRWVIDTTMGHLAVRIRGAQPIQEPEIVGIRPGRRLANPVILLSQGSVGRYRRLEWELERPEAVGCTSVTAGDFDNDMDLDLYFVCSGAVRNTANLLLANQGEGVFRDVTWEAGAQGVDSGRGDVAVVADYDRDGALDLFVTNGHGPPPFDQRGPYQLLRGVPNGNHWLEVDLVGTRSNRDGIGARVTVVAGGRSQWRVRSGGTHSFAQDHKRLHFGLGGHGRVERLVVEWPSGTRQVLEDLAADRVVAIREPRR